MVQSVKFLNTLCRNTMFFFVFFLTNHKGLTPNPSPATIFSLKETPWSKYDGHVIPILVFNLREPVNQEDQDT